MKVKANQDIRDYMKDRNVSQIDLGKYLGTHNRNISSMLHKELPESKKEELIRYIDAVAEENRNSIDEDIFEDTSDDITEQDSADVTVGPKFSIGDRVKIPSKQLCIGIVGDIWHSLSNDALMYAVDTEDGRRSLYAENQLEPAPIPTVYHFTADISGNVAAVAMIATQGDKERVVARGHAHILHDGEAGMAQAISYAARRMFESLDKLQENRIYVKEER